MCMDGIFYFINVNLHYFWFYWRFFPLIYQNKLSKIEKNFQISKIDFEAKAIKKIILTMSLQEFFEILI